jgi:hypothetical protein
MPEEEKPAKTSDQAAERIESTEREEQGSLAARLLAIAREAAPLWREPWRSTEHGELLYGEDGLPLESE